MNIHLGLYPDSNWGTFSGVTGTGSVDISKNLTPANTDAMTPSIKAKDAIY
jgi:hypothetical protein